MHKKYRLVQSGMKFCALVAALLAVGCGGAGDPQQNMQEARKYISAGNISAAEIALKNVLAVQAENAESRYLLGMIKFESNNLFAAEKELERALQLGYPGDEVYPLLAEVYYLLGRYEKLREQPKAYEELGPEPMAKVAFYRGLAGVATREKAAAYGGFTKARTASDVSIYGELSAFYLEFFQGKTKELETSVSVLVTDHPEFTEARVLLGKVRAANKDFPAAIESLEKALAQQPFRLHLYSDLAALQISNGQADAAEQTVDRLLKEAPEHPLAMLLKAELRLRQQDWEAARDLAEAVIGKGVSTPQPKLVSGIANFHLGNFEISQRHLTAVEELVPEGHEIHRMLAYMDLRQGKLDGLAESLQLLGEEDAGALVGSVGASLQRQGESGKALKLLEQAVDLMPEDAMLQTNLGILRGQLGDRQGRENVAEAVNLSPASLKPRLLLIQYALSENNLEEAQRLADQLAEARPETVESYLVQAEVDFAAQRVKNVRNVLERGLEKHPDDPRLLIADAKLKLIEGEEAGARRRLEQVLAIEPENILANAFLYRLMAMEAGGAAEGVEFVRSQSRRFPGNSRLKLLLAQILGRENSAANAYSIIEGIPSDDPNYVAAQRLGAAIAFSKEDYPRSGDFGERWIDAEPQNLQAYYTRLVAALAADRKNEALSVVEGGVKRLPDNHALRLFQLRLMLELGQINQAVNRHRLFNETFPESVNGDLLMASYLGKQAAREKAVPYLQLAAEKASDSQRLYAVARVYKELELEEKLRDLLAEKLVQTSASEPLQMLYADTLFRLKDPRAGAVYMDIIERNATNFAAMNNLALFYTEQELYEPALKYAEMAFQIKPDLAAVQDTYGFALVRSGQKEKGEALLKKAYDSAGESEDIAYHYAYALVAVGKSSEARAVLDEIQAADEALREKVDTLRVRAN